MTLNLPELDLLHLAEWLNSDLNEGIDRRQRTNIYYLYTIIRKLLTRIILLTDSSTFNQEIKKVELKKEKTTATFEVD